MFREFARKLLASSGFDSTREAANGEEALEVAGEMHPDVVLLDVNLPGIDGFEVARRLAAEDYAPQVVLTSSRDAADFGSRLVEAPIRGFIPKGELSGAALAALVIAE